MGRRLATLGLCCAALTAAAPVPSALAQDASSSAPGRSQVGVGSATAPASTVVPASSTAPAGSSAIPAGTLPPPSTTAPPSSAAPATASSTAPAGVSGQTPGPTSDDSKLHVLLLAVIGALLLLAALAWGAARWWAYEPPWWIRWRHATAEAGWRTSAAWAEFRDWVRLGR